MEDSRDHAGHTDQRSSGAAWSPQDLVEKLGSVSLDSNDENSRRKEYNVNEKSGSWSSNKASQILWRTGMLSEPIPNGFYSIVAVSLKTELVTFMAYYFICICVGLFFDDLI